jgi:hypothetical protein
MVPRRPPGPPGPPGPPPRRPPAPPTRPERLLAEKPIRPSGKWRAAFGGLAIVLSILGAYDLIIGGDTETATPAGSAFASPRSTVVASGSGVPSSAGTTTARPSGKASASASPSGSAAPVRELSVLSVAAFGPHGTSDGDNPDGAPRVLTVDGTSPWTSSWYATPDFGRLKAGTGLLLDMGRVVSVSSVRVHLGESVGADLQVRLGDTAGGPADLSAVASASDVGGTVHLTLAKAERGRYILIWFTKLPPNSTGKYQVNVYSVTVDGRK